MPEDAEKLMDRLLPKADYPTINRSAARNFIKFIQDDENGWYGEWAGLYPQEKAALVLDALDHLQRKNNEGVGLGGWGTYLDPIDKGSLRDAAQELIKIQKGSAAGGGGKPTPDGANGELTPEETGYKLVEKARDAAQNPKGRPTDRFDKIDDAYARHLGDELPGAWGGLVKGIFDPMKNGDPLDPGVANYWRGRLREHIDNLNKAENGDPPVRPGVRAHRLDHRREHPRRGPCRSCSACRTGAQGPQRAAEPGPGHGGAQLLRRDP